MDNYSWRSDFDEKKNKSVDLQRFLYCNHIQKVNKTINLFYCISQIY